MHLKTIFFIADSHIHVAMLGESQYFVDLADCYSVDSLQEKVSAHILRYPDLPWVIGVNWDQTKLGVYPHREHIDSVHTDKPVNLQPKSYFLRMDSMKVINTEACHRSSYGELAGTSVWPTAPPFVWRT